MTLTEFLLQRIGEDEAAARAGISSQADPENGWGLIETRGFAGLTLSPHVGHIHERVQGEHIIRWHPARVLAECEAKRRIVEAADEATGLDMQVDSEFRVGFRDTSTEPYLGDVILRALALPYADHPDYRGEWKP